MASKIDLGSYCSVVALDLVYDVTLARDSLLESFQKGGHVGQPAPNRALPVSRNLNFGFSRRTMASKTRLDETYSMHISVFVYVHQGPNGSLLESFQKGGEQLVPSR